MALTTKTPRLLEAAKEFNVGKDTLVAFLAEKGFEINGNPSFKLTERMYNAIQVAFEHDKHAKRKSDKIVLPESLFSKSRSLVDLDILLKDKKEQLAKAKEEELAKKIEPAKVIPVTKKTVTLTDEQEYLDVKVPKIEGPNILGKINLDELNLAPRPKKGAAKNKETKEVKEKEIANLKREEDAWMLEHIEIKAPKLEGPKIIGKIELPTQHMLAKEKIALSIKNKETNINLSNMGLSFIPIEIAKCTHLREINMQNNHLETIEHIKDLGIELLNLSSNQLKNIDFSRGFENLIELALNNNNLVNVNFDSCKKLEKLQIDGNSLVDFEPLSTLTNLRELNASRNYFDDIDSVLKLKKLTKLNLNSNKIHELFGIGALTELAYLNLGRNKIENIDEISALTKIRVLDLSENNITNIDALSNLKVAKKMYLGDNQISDIEQLSFFFKKKQTDKEINLSNNFVKHLKISNDEYENHYEVLYEYFRRIQNNTYKQTSIHFAQLLVLGNGEVGKTSVLRTIAAVHRIKEEILDDGNSLPIFPEESTHGNIHYYWDVKFSKSYQGDSAVTLLIKDFGGQEYYHHFHPVFYNANALYWVVFTPYEHTKSNPDNGSFPPQYWLKNITHSLSVYHQHEDDELKFDVWLIQNKIDKNIERLTITDSYQYCKYFPICSLNAREFEKLDETIQNKYHAARELLYYELVDYLEQSASNEKFYSFSLNIFNKLREIYSKNKSVKICYNKDNFKRYLIEDLNFEKEIVDSNIETILSELRYLGICLYFPSHENLKDLVYLYPERLSEIIFEKVLPIETITKKNGVLDIDNLYQHAGIRNLLEHFEIIFKDGETNNWIVPQYLPKKSADEDLIRIASDGLSKHLEIFFDGYMPQGIMSRLISFFGQNPHKKWYWRNGIFFTH